MKTIIAGSRTATRFKDLLTAVSSCPFLVSEVISGTARGADRLGERYAAELGLNLIKYPAEWERYGKFAGHKRNMEMAEVAEALIALWDGVSKGTEHMISVAKAKNLLVHIHIINTGN